MHVLKETLHTTGSPTPEIIWRRGSKQLKPKKNKRIKIEYDISSEVSSLIVKDATPEDSGEYSIEATNDSGTVKAKVDVTVQAAEEPDVETEAGDESVKTKDTIPATIPKITLSPEPVNVEIGETIQLSCVVKGVYLTFIY